MKGRDIKIKEPMLRIKDFNIPTDGGFIRSEGHPVQTTEFFLERPSESFLWFKPEKLCCRGVDKLDLTLYIGHDDAFLQRVKDTLQEALLVRQPDEIILHFLRLNPPDALDQL